MDGGSAARETRPSRGRRLAWWSCLLAVLLLLLTVALYALNDGAARANFDVVALGVALSYVPVGALVATRRPRHPVGWLLLLIGTGGLLENLAAMYGGFALITSPGALPLGSQVLWSATLVHIPALGLLATFLLLLFPTGRLPTRRWRPVAAAAAVGIVLLVLAWLLNPEPVTQVVPPQPSPLGDAAVFARLTPLWVLGLVLLAVAVLASICSLFVRLRTADGDRRRQLFWVVLAGTLSALTLFSLPTLPDPVVALLTLIVLPLLPFSIGIAIVRHGLLDIEMVVRRTVVYGALAAFVGAGYLAVVSAAGLLVGGRVSDDPRTSVLAAAVVAVGFAPARRRIEQAADRLVFGPRTSPYETLAETSRRLSQTVSVDEVLPGLAESLGYGLRAAVARAAVQLPDGSLRAATWPPDAAPDGSPLEAVAPVVDQGQPIGRLEVSRPPDDPMSPSDTRLLVDLAAQAGPALRSVRLAEQLAEELRRTALYAEDLRRSRARVVEAADAERRRIERDLHDGAQHHLVALAFHAGQARRGVHDTAATAAALDQLTQQAGEALRSLRELARGVYPPALEVHGLVSTLRSHLAKTVPHAELTVSSGAERRFDAKVEAAVYFCCVEALQNCAKHARGAPVHVLLDADDAHLRFEVRDGGPGFPAHRLGAGAGLANLEDRIAALGGAVEVVSSAAGTAVRGQVPLS